MAVPKSKTSKSKRNMRRAHHALNNVNISFDSNGEPVLSHHVSLKGNYKGRNVFAKLEKVEEADSKKKAKAAPKAESAPKVEEKPKAEAKAKVESKPKAKKAAPKASEEKKAKAAPKKKI